MLARAPWATFEVNRDRSNSQEPLKIEPFRVLPRPVVVTTIQEADWQLEREKFRAWVSGKQQKALRASRRL